MRGRTLRDVLGERRRLDPSESLAVIEQVLAALAVAHRAGLVHRDVKPENILVAPPPNGSGDLVDAVVKVADFGLAHAVEPARRRGSGELVATAQYVAPELVAGDRADPRVDVYAAGIVLFEMLTGRVPFDGDRPADVAWSHVDRDVPPPSYVVPCCRRCSLVVGRAPPRPGGRPRDASRDAPDVYAARETSLPRRPTVPSPTHYGVRPATSPVVARLPPPVYRPRAASASRGPACSVWWSTLNLSAPCGARHGDARRLMAGRRRLAAALMVGGWWLRGGR